MARREPLPGLPDQAGDGLNEFPVGLAPPTTGHLGHRQRARDRFLKVGSEVMEDYELLELALHILLPRRDTKPLAKQLLARFGSFSAVFAAPPERLAEISGLGETTIANLKVLQAVGQRFGRDKLRNDRPILGSWSELIEYCHGQMAFENIEQFRILFLDKKNQLIADEVQQEGTVDHTPVYPREVMRRALELSASALILVHNHPSGDPAPSQADIDMTRTIVETARPLGIIIHDHVIIGRQGHASLKGLQLM